MTAFLPDGQPYQSVCAIPRKDKQTATTGNNNKNNNSEFTHTNRQLWTKSTKRFNCFFYHTLVARCLHMINRHEKHTLGFFYLALSVPCLGKQHRHCTGVKQLFKLPLKHRSKQNEFPKLLPQQLKVWQWSAAVQKSPSLGAYSRTAERVPAWEDKTRFYAAHSLSLYSFPNHQRQLCTVADKKEVKLLKTWTSRLGVESAVCGVEVKETPLFSQQHRRGIQVSATANLNVWLHGLYVSFRTRVNLWLGVFGYSLFVSPPAVKMVKMAKFREKQDD